MIHPAGPRFPEPRGLPFLSASPAKAIPSYPAWLCSASLPAPSGSAEVKAPGASLTPYGPGMALQQPEIAKSSLGRVGGEALATGFELEKARKTSETGGAGWGDGS